MIPVSRPSITSAEAEEVAEVLRSGWITQGERVSQLERAFASYLKMPEVVACSTGTAALHLSLLALGVGPGDEVLVPDLTYVATANAVRYVGATPVLVDVEPDTWLIDLRHADRQVTSRTKAIIPVHLYGVPCDMEAVVQLANAYKLDVIEDAAEALGGRWKADLCGAWSDCGVFSLYGNKIITSGEGGLLSFWDHDRAERARYFRGQCVELGTRFFHTDLGYNYRLTDVQAAIATCQLQRIEPLLAERRRVFEVYSRALGHMRCPVARAWEDRIVSPWLFTFAGVKSRDALAIELLRVGIDTRPVFVPLHRLPMYAASDAEFPVATELGDTGISLPTYVGMTSHELEYVIDRTLDTIEELS